MWILQSGRDLPFFWRFRCRQTTLLDCLSGLVHPEEGGISIEGRILFSHTHGVNVPVAERKIGYLFQDLALFPHLTVQKNIEYGLSKLTAAERQHRSPKFCNRFESRSWLNASRAKFPVERVSGSRWPAPWLPILACCCWTSRWPHWTRLLSRTFWMTCGRGTSNTKFPSSTLPIAARRCLPWQERVLVLENGRVIAYGTPHEVMAAPQNETVAQLVGFENIFDAVVSAAHEARGTMTCRLGVSEVQLETPLVRMAQGSRLRLGTPAGDILLATTPPVGLSARNILKGEPRWLEQRDVTMVAKVDCGVEMEVHLTLAARDTLGFAPGSKVWLIIKTYSCHLMKG